MSAPGTDLSGATVLVDGVVASGLRLTSPDALSFVVPPALTNRSTRVVVEVRSPTRPRARARYDYQAVSPTVLTSTPQLGPTEGGTTVTVSGTGFVDGMQVFVGAASAISPAAGGPTVLEFATPAAAAGPATVTIFHPDGPRVQLPAPFSYVAPTRLTFVDQPVSAREGTILTAVRVALEDASGTLIHAPRDVTLELLDGRTAILGGTRTVRAAAGVATFDDLVVDAAAANVRLRATSPGLLSATSDLFDIQPPPDDHGDDAASATPLSLGGAVAGRIEVAGDPDWFAVSLASFTPYVLRTQTLSTSMDTVLTLFDRDGTTALATNDDDGATRASRIEVSPTAAGTYFLCVTHRDGASGVGTYELVATLRPPPPAAPAPPGSLTVMGVRPTRVDLRWTDASSNEDSFQLERRLLGVGAFAGVAAIASNRTTFSDPTAAPETAYEYRLLARNGAGDSSPSNVVSATTPPARPHLRFDYGPTSTPAGRQFQPELHVSVFDAQGELVTSTVVVSIAFGANPSFASLGGLTDRSTSGGIAVFAGLTVDRFGLGYTLVASAPGYDPVTSATFDITADRLVFSRSPDDATSGGALSFQVRAVDSFGTLDTTFGDDVEITAAAGPAGLAFGGTTVKAAGRGFVEFGALEEFSLDVTGTYELQASARPRSLFGRSAAFVIRARALPPRILTFDAAPGAAAEDEAVALSWTVSALATLDLAPGGDVTGTSSAIVTPFPVGSADTIVPYVLRAATAEVTTEAATVTWAVQAIGSQREVANDVAALPDGTTFTTGYFRGTTTFGPGEPGETTLTSSSLFEDDIFVARHAPDGTLSWVRRAGGTGRDQGIRLCATPAGDGVVISGAFNANAVFGPGEVNQTTLTTSTPRGFVARFDAATGALAWAKVCGQFVFDVTTLSQGDAVVTGFFFGTSTFGAGEAGARTLTSLGGTEDAFLVRLSAATGSLVWAVQAGGNQFDYGRCVVTLTGDDIVLGGSSRSTTTTFGAGLPGATTLVATSPTGAEEGFLVRYRADASVVWARRLATLNYVQPNSLAATLDGTVYVAGNFNDGATFAPGAANERTFVARGQFGEGFLARYDGSGQLSWVRSIGGGDQARTWAVAALLDGGAVITGDFEDLAIFGQGEPTESLLRPPRTNGYLARFADDGDFSWVTRLASGNGTQGTGVATASYGAVFVTGQFQSADVVLGVGDPTQLKLGPSGSDDLFLARFDLVNCRMLAVPRR